MINIPINGTNYPYPVLGDENWGPSATNFAVAIAGATLQPNATSFFLTTGDLDWGPNFGLEAIHLTSRSTNPAAAGVLRLSNTDTINWRNAANSADLALGVNASNQLTFGGNPIVGPSGVIPATSGGTGISSYTIGDTLYADSTTTLAKLAIGSADQVLRVSSGLPAWGLLVNANISPSAAISRSKIAAGTADHVVINDGSGLLSSEAQLAITRGGTGQATASAAFDALSPLTADGDLIYRSGGTAVRLPVGNNTDVLTVAGGLPSWQSAAAVGGAQPAKNYLINGNFDFWQRASGIFNTATGSTDFAADRWYVKNSLGIGSNVSTQRVTGTASSAKYGSQIKIDTGPITPVSSGLEYWQVIENSQSLELYNQSASLRVLVKALGNVTQVGVQFMYSTSEVKPLSTATIGSEVLTTVNSGSFTACEINGQALGTAMTKSGCIAVRIRPTAVSSGNLSDANNGFIVEQSIVNLGAAPATFQRAGRNIEEELAMCERFYEKSYNLETAPGSSLASGDPGLFTWGHTNASLNNVTVYAPLRYSVVKRTAPSVVLYAPNGSSGVVLWQGGPANVTGFTSNIGERQFTVFALTGTTTGNDVFEAAFTADAEI